MPADRDDVPSRECREMRSKTSPPAIFRAANAVMATLFLFGAAVQYNDPDPLRWMAIYLAAATACVLATLDRMPRMLPILVGLAALVWMATLAPHVLGRVGFGEMVAEWEMKDARVEEGREAYGLLIAPHFTVEGTVTFLGWFMWALSFACILMIGRALRLVEHKQREMAATFVRDQYLAELTDREFMKVAPMVFRETQHRPSRLLEELDRIRHPRRSSPE